MRKIALIGLLGSLALALSGCAIVAPAPTFRFDSNWQRTTDGAFVFCSNRRTLMRYSFPGPADRSHISSVTEVYHGYANRETLRQDRPTTDLTWDAVAGRWVFTGELRFGAGLVPQSLPPGVSQQSIVVTPIAPPAPGLVGTTMVTVMVKIGGRSISGSYPFDVYVNCP